MTGSLAGENRGAGIRSIAGKSAWCSFFSSMAVPAFSFAWLIYLPRVLGNTGLGFSPGLPVMLLGFGAGLYKSRPYLNTKSYRIILYSNLFAAAYGLSTFYLASGFGAHPLLDAVFALPAWEFELLRICIYFVLLFPLSAALGLACGTAMSESGHIPVTAGSLLAAYLAGVWFVRLFEVVGLVKLASLFSLLSALSAESAARQRDPKLSTNPYRTAWVTGSADAASFFAGFFFAAVSIAWLTPLMVIVEPTIYGIGVVFAGLMFGPAAGSMLAFMLARKNLSTPHSRSILLAAASILSVVLSCTLSHVQALVSAYSNSGGMWSIHAKSAAPLLFLGLPGALFFASGSCRASAPNLAVLSLGAALGVVAAGTLAVPLLGVFSTLKALAVLCCLSGLLLILSYKHELRSAAAYVSVLLVIAATGAIVIPEPKLSAILWTLAPLHSDNKAGSYEEAVQNQRRSIRETSLVLEGSSSIVSRRTTGPGRNALFLDGYARAWTVPDSESSSDMLAALVGGLLQPHVRNVLLAGTGTVVPAHILSNLGAKKVDVIEPDRVAFEAMGSVQDDERINRVVNDPRNVLRANAYKGELYDLVVFEVQSPWTRESSSLLTRDAFTIAKRALSHDGIFCLRLFLGRMDEDSFRSIARAMADVFPEAILFDFQKSHTALFAASKTRFHIDLDLASARLNSIGAKLPFDLPTDTISGKRSVATLMLHAISSWSWSSEVVFPPDPANTDTNAFAEIGLGLLPRWYPLPLSALSPVFSRKTFFHAFLSKDKALSQVVTLFDSLLTPGPTGSLWIEKQRIQRAERLYRSLNDDLDVQAELYLDARFELAKGRPGNAVTALENMDTTTIFLEARRQAFLGLAMIADGDQGNATAHLEAALKMGCGPSVSKLVRRALKHAENIMDPGRNESRGMNGEH